MTNAVELTKADQACPPEFWTSYGRLTLTRKTAVTQGENPIQVTGSKEDARSALAEIDGWMKPAPDGKVIEWLSALFLKTVSQGMGDEDYRAKIKLYAAELRRFPADVVRDAIRNYRGDYFPTFNKLQEAIERDRRIHERMIRAKAVRAFLEGEERPKGPPPTDAQLERAAQWVRQNRGDEPAPLSQEKLDRLAEVDRIHGEAAKAKLKSTFKQPAA